MTIPTQIEHINIDLLNDFPEHPFRVQLDEDMQTLIQSIYDHGITSPLLLWEHSPNYFIILSGHRRAYSRLYLNENGYTNEPTVPALVYRDITLEEATIIMVDENAKREHLLPSERAFAYKMKMDAMKRQGKRTDLTSGQVVQKLEMNKEVTLGQVVPKLGDSTTSGPLVQKLDTSEEIGTDDGESGRQVRRYIRLTYLIPELLEMVDSEKLGFRAAVEISYLTENEQKQLCEIITRVKRAPDLRQANILKKESKNMALTNEKIEEILSAVRYDDRVTFRLRPAQLKQLDEVSADAQLNRSEILRAYTSTGGAVFVGKDTISEMIDIKNDIARLGNLMKMQQNRLDFIAENPLIASDDREILNRTMGDFQSLYQEIQKQLKKLNKVSDKLVDEVADLNLGKSPI